MQNLMDFYLAEELTSELTLDAEKHLLRCNACAGEAHALQQTQRLLREAILSEEPNPSFRERTAARLLDQLLPAHRSTTQTMHSRQWSLPFLATKTD